jgi:hypothetical protein
MIGRHGRITDEDREVIDAEGWTAWHAAAGCETCQVVTRNSAAPSPPLEHDDYTAPACAIRDYREQVTAWRAGWQARASRRYYDDEAREQRAQWRDNAT